MQSTNLDMITDGYSLDTLLRSIYVNPEVACIREIICNAIDSHIDSNISRPVEVSFDNDVFYVRDFGNGMSYNDVMEVLRIVFKSTKRDSEYEGTGSYGLGSKTVFGVINPCIDNNGDVVIMKSIHNGIMTVYLLSKDREGMPNIKPLYSQKTNDDSGISYKIPMNDKMKNIDVDTFLKLFTPFYDSVKFVGSYNYFKHFKQQKMINGVYRMYFKSRLLDKATGIDTLGAVHSQSFNFIKNVDCFINSIDVRFPNIAMNVDLNYCYSKIRKREHTQENNYCVKIKNILYPYDKIKRINSIFGMHDNDAFFNDFNDIKNEDFNDNTLLNVITYVDYIEADDTSKLEPTKSRDSVIESSDSMHDIMHSIIRHQDCTLTKDIFEYSWCKDNFLNLIKTDCLLILLFNDIYKTYNKQIKDRTNYKLEFMNQYNLKYTGGLNMLGSFNSILKFPEVIEYLNSNPIIDIECANSLFNKDKMSVQDIVNYVSIFYKTSYITKVTENIRYSPGYAELLINKILDYCDIDIIDMFKPACVENVERLTGVFSETYINSNNNFSDSRCLIDESIFRMNSYPNKASISFVESLSYIDYNDQFVNCKKPDRHLFYTIKDRICVDNDGIITDYNKRIKVIFKDTKRIITKKNGKIYKG